MKRRMRRVDPEMIPNTIDGDQADGSSDEILSPAIKDSLDNFILRNSYTHPLRSTRYSYSREVVPDEEAMGYCNEFDLKLCRMFSDLGEKTHGYNDQIPSSLRISDLVNQFYNFEKQYYLSISVAGILGFWGSRTRAPSNAPS